MIEWRRDFHKYAESGWLEMRTASLVASRLASWGYEVKAGEDALVGEARMGVPSEHILRIHEERARKQGADPFWLKKVAGGYTGITATLQSKRPGKTIALRFDMDALDLHEAADKEHVPAALGFRSVNEGMMHACGHDAHTAIGLGAAKLLSDNPDSWSGTVKFIFQPAEEGVRGAKSMVSKGILDGVDLFLAGHVGTGVPLGEVVTGTAGFLATTKVDARFQGVSSHAGAKPEEGKNALLAAAAAVSGLHGIPRHSKGNSRVNVGVLQSGTSRNSIPSEALLKLETRGETTEVNEFIFRKSIDVLKGAAIMHDVDLSYSVCGEAKGSTSTPGAMGIIDRAAQQVGEVKRITGLQTFAAGSEDATWMMDEVMGNGGEAAYAIYGTELAAGHHNERFDLDERVMLIALKTLFYSVCLANEEV